MDAAEVAKVRVEACILLVGTFDASFETGVILAHANTRVTHLLL